MFESDQLKLDIIKEIHDQSISEHSDVRRSVNIFINDIIDHKQNNQLSDTFEIVISAKDSKRSETNIQIY
jgi:hypothetical protein